MSPDQWTTIARKQISGVFVALLLPSLINLDVEGRKCICTSKACKQSGEDTCTTEISCYTELIMSSDQEVIEAATTRGCIERATPLMCETKSWVTRSKSTMPWPRLMCCDSHDYCNADHRVNASIWPREEGDREKEDSEYEDDIVPARTFGNVHGPNYRHSAHSVGHDNDPDSAEDYSSTDQLLLSHRVRPLHVAALILAIAALISVLAACYVITRFLRSYPYVAGSVE